MNFLEYYKIENDNRMSLLTKKQKRLLAIMCLERQFKSYENMALYKDWNRSSDYRQLLDNFWSIVLNEERPDESIWEFHEKINPEKVNKSIIEYDTKEFNYANIFSYNVIGFIENLLDDIENEETFRLSNIDYILCYLNEETEGFCIDEYQNNELISNEILNQEQDVINMKKIGCLNDAKKWYIQCKSLI